MVTIKRRLILCGNNTTQPKYQGGQAVNIIGKYLFKHIDGAYNFKKGANTYDVYFTILYQLKEDYRTDKDHDMHEMNINISTMDSYDRSQANHSHNLRYFLSIYLDSLDKLLNVNKFR